MELVLKTSDAATHRGFESHPFRHISTFRTGAVSERSFFCSVLVTSRIVGWREDFTFLHIVNVL